MKDSSFPFLDRAIVQFNNYANYLIFSNGAMSSSSRLIPAFPLNAMVISVGVQLTTMPSPKLVWLTFSPAANDSCVMLTAFSSSNPLSRVAGNIACSKGLINPDVRSWGTSARNLDGSPGSEPPLKLLLNVLVR